MSPTNPFLISHVRAPPPPSAPTCQPQRHEDGARIPANPAAPAHAHDGHHVVHDHQPVHPGTQAGRSTAHQETDHLTTQRLPAAADSLPFARALSWAGQYGNSLRLPSTHLSFISPRCSQSAVSNTQNPRNTCMNITCAHGSNALLSKPQTAPVGRLSTQESPCLGLGTAPARGCWGWRLGACRVRPWG